MLCVSFCWLVVPFPIVATIKRIVKEYYDRMYICEEQKWDLEREVRKRDWEVQQLSDTLFFMLTIQTTFCVFGKHIFLFRFLRREKYFCHSYIYIGNSVNNDQPFFFFINILFDWSLFISYHTWLVLRFSVIETSVFTVNNNNNNFMNCIAKRNRHEVLNHKCPPCILTNLIETKLKKNPGLSFIIIRL